MINYLRIDRGLRLFCDVTGLLIVLASLWVGLSGCKLQNKPAKQSEAKTIEAPGADGKNIVFNPLDHAVVKQAVQELAAVGFYYKMRMLQDGATKGADKAGDFLNEYSYIPEGEGAQRQLQTGLFASKTFPEDDMSDILDDPFSWIEKLQRLRCLGGGTGIYAEECHIYTNIMRFFGLQTTPVAIAVPALPAHSEYHERMTKADVFRYTGTSSIFPYSEDEIAEKIGTYNLSGESFNHEEGPVLPNGEFAQNFAFNCTDKASLRQYDDGVPYNVYAFMHRGADYIQSESESTGINWTVSQIRHFVGGLFNGMHGEDRQEFRKLEDKILNEADYLSDRYNIGREGRKIKAKDHVFTGVKLFWRAPFYNGAIEQNSGSTASYAVVKPYIFMEYPENYSADSCSGDSGGTAQTFDKLRAENKVTVIATAVLLPPKDKMGKEHNWNEIYSDASQPMRIQLKLFYLDFGFRFLADEKNRFFEGGQRGVPDLNMPSGYYFRENQPTIDLVWNRIDNTVEKVSDRRLGTYVRNSNPGSVIDAQFGNMQCVDILPYLEYISHSYIHFNPEEFVMSLNVGKAGLQNVIDQSRIEVYGSTARSEFTCYEPSHLKYAGTCQLVQSWPDAADQEFVDLKQFKIGTEIDFRLPNGRDNCVFKRTAANSFTLNGSPYNFPE